MRERNTTEDEPQTTGMVAPTAPTPVGIIIVDHGSTRAESNDMLDAFVAMFRVHSHYGIVEPAHMELAEPSIATAFARCVQQGAASIVVSPYFLSPGRHWHSDIPRLASEAARAHEGISYLVGAPIGLHPMMVQVVQSRIDHCLQHAVGEAPDCDVCEGTDRCVMRGSDPPWRVASGQ